MKSGDTPRRRGMANYYRFSLFNVISFNFLAGNIIVLYALRLGAGNVMVGLIAASYQITFIFSLIGRQIIARLGAVKLMGYFWFVRYLLMIPILLTALPVMRGHSSLVLAIVGLCVFGFNVSKGIGITAVRPIVGELPPRRERGAFLSNQYLITNIGAIGTGLVMAFVLGPESSLGRYALLLAVGMVAGFGASYFILRLPEPVEAVHGFDSRFVDGLRIAFRDRTFKRLNAVNIIAVGVTAMAEAFLLVFFRGVYGYSDQTVVFFIVAGSVGAAIMATFSRSVMDRVGPKPLLFAFAGVTAAILIPVAIAPDVTDVWRYLFPSLIFFFFSMGRFGMMSAADNYFYSITQAEDRLDLGIVFGLAGGIAGSLGSFLGGVLLSGLEQNLPAHPVLPFTIYFALVAAIMFVGVLLVTRMADVDSIPIPNALGILVSPRDLRAIRLLNRLRRSRTQEEEYAAVRALGESSSALTADELAEKVSSPSLIIRMEAINSLRNTPLTREVEDLLISDVKTHTFTTAHLSAELLGAAGVKRAIPVLREAIGSGDYMVSAKAMFSLAQLRDDRSIARIEEQLQNAANARIAIYAVKALETLGSVRSLPVILGSLARSSELFVRDELILSCARLLGIFDWFYPLYLEFLQEPAEARRSLTDAATTLSGPARSIVSMLDAGMDQRSGETQDTAETVISHLCSNAMIVRGVNVARALADALETTTILSLVRFRFFLAAALIALRSERQ